MTSTTHDPYFATVPSGSAERLALIRSTVESLLPDAEPCISYRMPAYRAKRVFFYFAAFQKHIGIYPPVTRDADLVRELAPFRNAKGNLAFPLDQPLPVDLIGRVAIALHREYAGVPSPAEARIQGFLDKYSPDIARQLGDARTRLRALFSRGFELVYDNHNALVFAISPTAATADAFVSVAGYPRWVTLFFLRGVDLHDPNGLLEGRGKQVRSVRLRSADAINTPAVEALILQAALPLKPQFLAAPPISTIIRGVVDRQRPRRPS